MDEVARDVIDPQTKVSVQERARAYLEVNGPTEAAKDVRERGALRLAALGSGSDFTPFLQHMGVASLNIGFGGEADGGSYHSIYDSIDHYTRFMDPSFEYGVTLAKMGGRTVLRLANADLLPFDASAPVAETVAGYSREVQKLADDLREKTEDENRSIRARVVRARGRPHALAVAPKAKEPVPFMNFAPLQNAVARLQRSAAAYQKAGALEGLSPQARSARNAAFIGLERKLTRSRGPARPALVHPPGLCPGLLHGLRGEDVARHPRGPGAAAVGRGPQQIEIVARTLDGFSAELERLATP